MCLGNDAYRKIILCPFGEGVILLWVWQQSLHGPGCGEEMNGCEEEEGGSEGGEVVRQMW
jgi:hypothetical protein